VAGRGILDHEPVDSVQRGVGGGVEACELERAAGQQGPLLEPVDIGPPAGLAVRIAPGDRAWECCVCTMSLKFEHDLVSWLNVGRAPCRKAQGAKLLRAARGGQRARTD